VTDSLAASRDVAAVRCRVEESPHGEATGGVVTDEDLTILGAVLGDRLPSLMNGQFKRMSVNAGGLVPWDDIAHRILTVDEKASGDWTIG
jgi:hypothetical protein